MGRRSVETIEARLVAAAVRQERRALARLERLVQPAARRRAGAELGRARAALGRAAAQAERIAERAAAAAAAAARRQADYAERYRDRRSAAAYKGAATRAERARTEVTAHNQQRKINRESGFAPPPPLPQPRRGRARGAWFRDTFPAGRPIFRGAYTVGAVTVGDGGTSAVLTLTRGDGQSFFIGVIKGSDGRPRFTPRQLTFSDAELDVLALAEDYE
jgi:hypothetical protein